MAPGKEAEYKKGARSTDNRFMDLDMDMDVDMDEDLNVDMDGEVPLLLVIPFVWQDNGDLCTVSMPACVCVSAAIAAAL